MSGHLSIGRLTLRGQVDADRLLHELEPREDDRRVLVVRRMSLEHDEPQKARDRLSDLRRSAAHPAVGGVPVDAVAVEFADEAEALACLSCDVLAGTAHQRWWWTRRLPRYAASREDELTALWTANPRLVPAVLAGLAVTVPDGARTAVAGLGSGAPRVLTSVAAEFPTQFRSAAGRAPGAPGDEPLTPADHLIAVAAAVTGAPALLRQQTSTGRPDPASGAARSGPIRDDESSGGVAALPTARETSSGAHRSGGSVVGRVSPITEVGAAVDMEPRPAPQQGADSVPVRAAQSTDDQGPSPDAALPDAVADLDRERRLRRTVAAEPSDPYEVDIGSPTLPPWLGSGFELDSQLATMLYVVNLMRRFRLDELAEPPATGWAVVEALARALLDDLDDPRRRELIGDPLLPLLVRLDGRGESASNPVVLNHHLDLVRSWLADQDIPPTTFAHPGVVYVSRTHVDVVLPLAGIDLAARRSGLDQDPGWVPELARIVLFHFRET